jgi:hypothetical protein
MPTRPTKDTTAVNIELPTELMERVRDFSRRDMRSIKMEFIRALELLLDTYDKPAASSGGLAGSLAPSSADTLKDQAQPTLQGGAVPKPASALAQMDNITFAQFLDRLAKRENPLLYYLAVCRRRGLTAEQIVNENSTLELSEIRPLVESLEKKVRGETQR